MKWIPGVIWIWISALIILFGTSLAIWPDTRRAAAASVRTAPGGAAGGDHVHGREDAAGATHLEPATGDHTEPLE